MDLLSSTTFNGVIFPAQVAACIIHFFFHVELVTYCPSFIVSAL